MMKDQLAGLMKQAQQMQENMKKMQDQLALIEVEGQSGAGLVKVTMTCKNDVRRVSDRPEPARRRQGHAGRPGRRRVQRRRAQGRSHHAGKDERHDGRHADAAGLQDAVLIVLVLMNGGALLHTRKT